MGKKRTKFQFSELANKNYLAITPRQLGIDENMFNVDVSRFEKYVFPLIIETPSKLSNYGKKLNEYDFFKNKIKLNSKIEQLLNKLGVLESFYFFSTDKPKSNSKQCLNQEIISIAGPCMFLRIDDSVLESIYASIRNALAHGNVISRNGNLEFFCVTKEIKEMDNLDGNISFYLRIRNVMDLDAYLRLD